MLFLCAFFFFNNPATTEIYTLSLHDALPIDSTCGGRGTCGKCKVQVLEGGAERSEEHTSELQSRPHLVCRLLLEKKKRTRPPRPSPPTGTAYLGWRLVVTALGLRFTRWLTET